MLVAVAILFDLVFDPKNRWQLYSKATDLLVVAELKRQGEYEDHAQAIEVLLATEAGRLEKLVEIKDLLEKLQQPQRTK